MRNSRNPPAPQAGQTREEESVFNQGELELQDVLAGSEPREWQHVCQNASWRGTGGKGWGVGAWMSQLPLLFPLSRVSSIAACRGSLLENSDIEQQARVDKQPSRQQETQGQVNEGARSQQWEKPATLREVLCNSTKEGITGSFPIRLRNPWCWSSLFSSSSQMKAVNVITWAAFSGTRVLFCC